MGCNKNQFQFVCQRIAEQPTLYFCIRIRHPYNTRGHPGEEQSKSKNQIWPCISLEMSVDLPITKCIFQFFCMYYYQSYYDCEI